MKGDKLDLWVVADLSSAVNQPISGSVAGLKEGVGNYESLWSLFSHLTPAPSS